MRDFAQIFKKQQQQAKTDAAAQADQKAAAQVALPIVTASHTELKALTDSTPIDAPSSAKPGLVTRLGETLPTHARSTTVSMPGATVNKASASFEASHTLSDASNTSAEASNQGLRLGSCTSCNAGLVPGNWYHHMKTQKGVCRRCYYVDCGDRRDEFFWVSSTEDIVRALKPNAFAEQGKSSNSSATIYRATKDQQQPVRVKQQTKIVPKPRMNGGESLRRAAIAIAFKEMVMSSATESPEQVRKANTPGSGRPSILPANQATPARPTASSNPPAINSPALFWAAPPPPPAS